ncbi:MAG: sigma-70 family RNA polymerase sigma factor [Pirellulales bacterium]|nr:sigma-70 family RNA polymerase sigma factor [Pirellulales bacterium]
MGCRDVLPTPDDRRPHDTGNADPFATCIAAARAGCDDAFKKLYEAVKPYLLLIANQELVPELQAKVGASDIVQETLVHARQKFADFRGHTQEQLRAWTRDMLLKNVHDAKRRYLWTEMRQASRELSLDRDVVSAANLIDDEARGPEHGLALADDAQRLNAALAQLSDDHREVIRLRHWEQKSFAEIGQLLGRNAEAARQLWRRAVDRLRAQLHGSNGEHGA